MCNNEKNCSCISEILKVICVLQQNNNCADNCLDTCDRGFLGCSTTACNCNTRPIVIYSCGSNGIPWKMPISKENITISDNNYSNVFRIEKIDDCCATFRVLAPNPTDEENPYLATNSFFTMNLNCVCAIRCLQDTYVECI